MVVVKADLSSAGSIPDPGIRPVRDQSELINAVNLLIGFANSLRASINGNLSVGTGEPYTKAGNLRGEYHEVITPSTPNQEFSIPHGLGVVPAIVIPAVPPDTACRIYVSSYGSWSETEVKLKCDEASVTILFLLAA